MRNFLLNLLIAVLWMLLWDAFSIYGLLAGLAMGYVLVALYSRAFEGGTYGLAPWRLAAFALYFTRILVKANLQVAWEVITPGFTMSPRMLRYDVSGLTPVQVTTLASAISLTPGTLSCDIREEDSALYIHCMYASDRQAALRDIDELRDHVMKEVFGR